jgi:hypothetical protein
MITEGRGSLDIGPLFTPALDSIFALHLPQLFSQYLLNIRLQDAGSVFEDRGVSVLRSNYKTRRVYCKNCACRYLRQVGAEYFLHIIMLQTQATQLAHPTRKKNLNTIPLSPRNLQPSLPSYLSSSPQYSFYTQQQPFTNYSPFLHFFKYTS